MEVLGLNPAQTAQNPKTKKPQTKKPKHSQNQKLSQFPTPRKQNKMNFWAVC
jgi:hypothetical protein